MIGEEESDLSRLGDEAEEYLRGFYLDGPSKAPEPFESSELLEPSRASGKTFRWVAIYDPSAICEDPSAVEEEWPPHYPEIRQLFDRCFLTKIYGRMMPAPKGDHRGKLILEIDEHEMLPSEPRGDRPTSRGSGESPQEHLDRTLRQTRRSGREMVSRHFVPALALRTTGSEAIQALDLWFGIGRRKGSPYERRLVQLQRPVAAAWVWCKARSSHPTGFAA